MFIRAHLLRSALLLAAAGLSLTTSTTAFAQSAPAPRVERVLILMRHGVRSPLNGEVPAGTRTGTPWPTWDAPAEQITPHGEQALRALARSDRAWFARSGLLPASGCAGLRRVALWANTSSRTISSGEAYRAGFAPDCRLAVGHQPLDTTDPLFEPLNAHPAGFDAARAVESITRYNGGSMAALTQRHAKGLELLERVLACPERPCSPLAPSAVRPSGDGHGIDLSGPIRAASGTAQVLMLQYLEGMPMAKVGWGRLTPARLVELGAIHAALFDVFSRPPYMMAFQTAPVAERIERDFTRADAPKVDLLFGHDTNVAALAALLGVPVRAPGFAAGDPSPGGGIALALVRSATGARAVRVWYRTQSAKGIRAGTGAGIWLPLRLAGCDQGPAHSCPLPRFLARLQEGTAVARR